MQFFPITRYRSNPGYLGYDGCIIFPGLEQGKSLSSRAEMNSRLHPEPFKAYYYTTWPSISIFIIFLSKERFYLVYGK